jgi:hypothetical protein
VRRASAAQAPGSQVSWQGRDDGNGWCVSTDASDASYWPKNLAENTCKVEWSFAL